MPNAESYIKESIESSAALARFNVLVERRMALWTELKYLDTRIRETGKIVLQNNQSVRSLKESEYKQVCEEQFDHKSAAATVKSLSDLT